MIARIGVCCCLLILSLTGSAQKHLLIRKWETDTLLKTAAAVLYDAKGKQLFVSGTNGTADTKEGKGYIAKVSPDGTIINAYWVKGLNAPKGMGIYKNSMYVADLTEIVLIDIDKAAIIRRIPVEGAVLLNGITVDKNGVVYVSDTKTLKVHRLEKGLVFTFLETLASPAGLLAIGDELLVLDKGSLLKMTGSGKVSPIVVGMDPTTTGIDMVKENEYLISSMNGVIYYAYTMGEKTLLLDTRPLKINSAGIGYDARNRILYVATRYRNTIVAYDLQ